MLPRQTLFFVVYIILIYIKTLKYNYYDFKKIL